MPQNNLTSALLEFAMACLKNTNNLVGALGKANARSLRVKLPTANASPFPDFFILNLCCPLPTVNLLFKFQHFSLRPSLAGPRALPNKTAAETHSKNGRAGSPLHAAVCHVASLVGSLIRWLDPERYQTRQQRPTRSPSPGGRRPG